jgi:hypothetical protein
MRAHPALVDRFAVRFDLPLADVCRQQAAARVVGRLAMRAAVALFQVPAEYVVIRITRYSGCFNASRKRSVSSRPSTTGNVLGRLAYGMWSTIQSLRSVTR